VESVEKLFSMLCLPALKEVMVQSNDGAPVDTEMPDYEIPDAIRACIVASSADVPSFSWSGNIDQSSEVFLALMREMHRLETPALRDYILRDHIIDFLNRDLYTDICPVFSELDLLGSDLNMRLLNEFPLALYDAIGSRIQRLDAQKGETLAVNLNKCFPSYQIREGIDAFLQEWEVQCASVSTSTWCAIDVSRLVSRLWNIEQYTQSIDPFFLLDGVVL